MTDAFTFSFFINGLQFFTNYKLHLINSETFLQSAACCEELLKETKNSKES